MKAHCLFDLEKHEDSAKMFTKAIELDDDNIEAYIFRAKNYIHMK